VSSSNQSGRPPRRQGSRRQPRAGPGRIHDRGPGRGVAGEFTWRGEVPRTSRIELCTHAQEEDYPFRRISAGTGTKPTHVGYANLSVILLGRIRGSVRREPARRWSWCGGFEPTRRRRGALISGVSPRARCGLSVLRPGEALAGGVRSESSLIEGAAAKGAIKADEERRLSAVRVLAPAREDIAVWRAPTETVKGSSAAFPSASSACAYTRR
jgi:hypothetical protein